MLTHLHSRWFICFPKLRFSDQRKTPQWQTGLCPNKKVPFDTPVLSKGTMYFHSPRFHPFCFFKPLHLTITESPGRIGAAQSWSSITFLRKPLHHQMGFLSVTFAVIYSSLLRFVFLLRLLFRLSIFLDYTTHLVVVKSCIG